MDNKTIRYILCMIFLMTFTRRKWAHVCRLLGSSGSDKRPCQWWDILAWYHHKVTGLLISNTPAVCVVILICDSLLLYLLPIIEFPILSYTGTTVECCRFFVVSNWTKFRHKESVVLVEFCSKHYKIGNSSITSKCICWSI